MTRLGKFAALFLLFAFTPAAQAQIADWQKTWDETVTAAKKEGKVVIAGSPDPVMRNEVIPKFTARFGIPVEYIAGRFGDLATRVSTERSAGIYAATRGIISYSFLNGRSIITTRWIELIQQRLAR